MSLFSALGIGVTGMNASRAGLSTTGHNISNVNNESYTRQRITTSAMYAKDHLPNTGLGVKIDNVVRLHDEFVYSRLKTSSGNLEYSSYMKNTLQEIGQYFPDIQKVGIKEDLTSFFNAWNDFSSDPSSGAKKISLITKTQTLADRIHETRDKLRSVQVSINDQLKLKVDEINSLGKQIANINKEISSIETLEPTIANDLRDQRDKLELTLSKLVNTSVFKGDLKSDSSLNAHVTDKGSMYNVNIAGVSLVNGVTFSPLEITNEHNPASFYDIYSIREDEKKTNLSTLISGGSIGAMLDLRGREIITDNKNGYPKDGVIQNYIDDLDTFAKTLVININNVYAKSARDSMQSKPMSELKSGTSIMSYDKNIQKGSFDLVVYNLQGEKVAQKTINIVETTSLNSSKYTSSIIEQINSDTDTNHDNDTTNDFDDYFKAVYSYDQDKHTSSIALNRQNGFDGYTIAIEDHGTNFPGLFGMNEFLVGDNAKNINIQQEIKKQPDTLSAFSAPTNGNNEVANDIVQVQYKSVDFFRQNNTTMSETMLGFYGFLTANIATDAEQASINHDVNNALFKTVSEQFQSISGVSLDDELTNLMKYQTAYSANAKTLTTIDRMLNDLLGIR